MEQLHLAENFSVPFSMYVCVDYIYTHKFIYICKRYEKLSTQPKYPLEKLMYWLDVGKSVGLKPFQYQCVNMFYLYKSICAYILMHLYAYIYKKKLFIESSCVNLHLYASGLLLMHIEKLQCQNLDDKMLAKYQQSANICKVNF